VTGSLADLFAPARARTWWEFKTPIFLGVGYFTALAAGVSFRDAWPAFLVCVVAIIPLASYVCVINDITDEHVDAAAGKSNSMARKSRRFKVGWLSACLAAGIFVAMTCFEKRPEALVLYASNWLVFTLYSVPPFRLKERGFAGIITDACGGTVLPALWAALLVDPKISSVLFTTLTVWSLSFGLRGILYHQAGDLEADRMSGISTFSVRVGLGRVQRLVRSVFFPVEVLSLALILALSGSMFAVPMLLAYFASQFALWKWLQIRLVVVGPEPRSRLALLKYYQMWFPLTFILAMAWTDPWALVCLPLHAALFPDTWCRFLKHAREIWHYMNHPPAFSEK